MSLIHSMSEKKDVFRSCFLSHKPMWYVFTYLFPKEVLKMRRTCKYMSIHGVQSIQPNFAQEPRFAFFCFH